MEITGTETYPRTYRPPTTTKVLVVLLGLMCIGLGVASPIGMTLSGKQIDWGPVIILGWFGVLGLYLIATTFATQVVLHADAIEITGLRQKRRLARADIKGRKIVETRSSKITYLVPKDPAAKKLRMSSLIKTDAMFKQWIESLPDLDAEEMKRIQDEIVNDTSDGRTAFEHTQDLMTARKIAGTLKAVSFVALLAGYLFPEPYALWICVLAALPWAALAVAARTPKLYTLNDKKTDPRGGLGMPLILPGFVLMLRIIMDMHLLDWMPVHMGAIAIALFMAFLASLVDRKLVENRGIILVGLLLIPYGYGVLVMGNALLDMSTPASYQAKVVSKRYTGGKGSHPELTLGRWGEHAGGSLAVRSGLYSRVQPGDTVCVYLRNGRFGVPWYIVDLCGKEPQLK